ncbi:MAG: hypothetical protein H7Y22_02525, partial [Gemmatimonadaceae bacterium]|nr:hypothetical protein [Gloeobacterales cyanobacterium ES-bin-141]
MPQTVKKNWPVSHAIAGAFHRSALVAASIAAVALALPTPATAQSFPLTCKAGSSVQLSVGIANRTNTATVVFRPSNAPASAGVAPGFCAWSDRGWREGEPTTLTVRDAGRVVGSFQNGTYSDLRFSRGDIQGLEGITRNSGQTFIFQVHREGTGGNGTMVVDRVG